MDIGRRAFLTGVTAVGAGVAFPEAAYGGSRQAAVAPAPVRVVDRPSAATGPAPLPPAVRSRRALSARTTAALPIVQHASTYNLAQVVRWLDQEHFAVGRWDGTMSVYDFETAPFVGPIVTDVVNTPSAQGVRMITVLPRRTLVTSNDASSLAVWWTTSDRWADLRLRSTVSYDPALGAATSGAFFSGDLSLLVVGHDNGYLSFWSVRPWSRTLRPHGQLNVQNPDPVNPWNLHSVYEVAPLVASGRYASVIAGSDDGYLSIVRVPGRTIVSQTVFNPSAQRGINCVSVSGNKILVGNCSVGADDHNLWYFTADIRTGQLTLVDRANLIINPAEVQSFNFETVWGRYTDGPCWFAGTEEGALWMGTADTSIEVIGHQPLSDGAIGAALDYTDGPGRLAAVIHNLQQFTTGA
ncbi:WD40 repeat domain-containing protein [Plantactinospora endophytica]|uniref:Twin-arginine translocation signal domain-containing protein n=1 Tax=Plantactinospora endophytica TaxID=673535 RepID=A0ABQ4DV22_9ACTN|nr:WD40 repeat domain-containing protein [Plantactinospora endophytica]GIG86288.1 hypothetical protein Pen02_12240 [Plantactinospora endophytica]